MNKTTEEQVSQVQRIQISMVMADMTDQEIISILFPLQLGKNPQEHAYGYEKISSLLTQDDNTKMHDLAKTAFMQMAVRKLQE